MKYFIILNGKETRTIQAENLEEARNNAINLSDHSKEVIVREIEPKITYYLFGEEAVINYDNAGIENLIKELKTEDFGYSTFEFIEGVTKSGELVNGFDGWYSFTEILKEEYERLNDLN